MIDQVAEAKEQSYSSEEVDGVIVPAVVMELPFDLGSDVVGLA